MGGKDKKGQRTKGNAKPSSSGRSAELLGTTTGFIGFSGVPEGSYVPAVNVASHFPNDDAELGISADFRMTLRKMGKKDATTKIKALQEFTEYCEQSPIDVLKSVLTFWPRLFTRLSVDSDRRVRENTAKAHSFFAAKLGRVLAPHLKELMGAWYTSQCDTYTPASSVAVNSLKTCFPDKKLLDAVSFCHDEIMDYIYDSIFKEEQVSEDQKERTIVGGLAGYSLLLQQMSSKDLNKENVLSKHTHFWKNSKLYKAVKKESTPPIKQAWFRLAHSLAECMPHLAQENANKLLPSIFGFLDDSESVSLPALWETILKLLLVIEKASTYVNIPSHLTQRFLTLLAGGCYGNAHRIGPVALQLIHILRDFAQRKKDFDQEVISCLCQGFTVRTVSTSSMEALALSTCLFQTMEYVAESTQESSHIVNLFQTKVIPLLDSLVKSPTSNPPMCAVLRHMSTTFYSWCDNDNNCGLIDGVWCVLEGFMTSLLNYEPHLDPFAIDQIGWIIHSLLNPNFKPHRSTRLAVRAARTRFADSESSSISTPIPIPDQLNQKLIKFLGGFVCPKTMKCCQENQCQSCLNILSSLLCYDDKITELFLMSDQRTPQVIISQCIQPMLEIFQDSHSAALLFTILNTVDPSIRLKLLEDVIENESTAVALATTALEKFSHKETVIEWLQCEQVANLLKNVSLKLVTSDCSENDQHLWNLIEAAFKTSKTGTSASKETFLPESHLSGVLDTFSSHLSEENIARQPFQQYCNSLLSAWKVTGSPIHRLASAVRFLDTVIETLCSITLIPSECIQDLLVVWSHGAAFDIDNRSQTAVGIIKRKMLANPDEEIVERIVGIFQHVSKRKSAADLHGSLFKRLVPTNGEWKSLMNESNAGHLMAKECLIDGSSFVGVTSTVRSVNVKSWSGLIKVAYVVSSVSLDSLNTTEDQDSIDVMANLLYASTAADLLLSLIAKRFKTSELQSIEHFNQLLKSHIDTALSKSLSCEKTTLCRKVLANARNCHSIWLISWKKLQSICEDGSSDDDESLLELPYTFMSNEKRNLVLQNQMAILMSTDGSEWSGCHQLMATIRILLQDLKGEADSRTIDTAVHVVGILQNWQKLHNDDFLFGSNLKEALVSDTVLTVIEIIRYISLMVELFPQQLVDSLWDFILCSMTSWCSTLEDSWCDVSSAQMSNGVLISFTVAVCRLIGNSSATIVASQSAPPDAAWSLPINLVTEWNDLFAQVAFTTTIPIFHRLGRRWNHYANNPLCDWLMEAIALSLTHAPLQHITLTVDQLSPLLMAKQPLIQLATYHLIIKLIPSIVSAEGESVREDEEVEKKGREPPSALLDVLNNVKLDELENVRIGDLHIVEPYSEECSQLIAFCLTWKLILHMCGCSSSELRYQYATYLTDSGLMSRLMDNIFCIIPHASLNQVDLDQKFTPDIEIKDKVIQDLAVKVYYSALKHMPAVVRRWCNNADKRTATFVEKFTSKCVSPALCSSDLEHINSSWDNMMVKVRHSAREVIATYKLNEEASMELVIQLPVNYPLGSITVEGGRKVGVTSNQWRNWMLQLTTFLTHQNGSILDGLTLWKRNVDKRFEGVEECYICYYVLHGSNYQLPKLTCRTCRKKFHSACLYKWFNTSNNSTCPLCRNLF